MKINTKDALRDVHPSKVILPVLIGIAVAAYIFFREGEIESLSVIQPTWTVVFFLMVAILLVCFRILGYMIRLRILSEGKLSYFKILRIVLLWEFASAVTPSAVGGTSVALLFLYKEVLPIGKGAAVVLGTLFLDELYFVLVFPIVAMLIGFDNLFALSKVDAGSFLDNKYFYFAIAGYGVKVCIVLLVGYGLFFNPQALKRFILLIFSIPGLRRWKEKAAESGDDIVDASRELSSKPFKFWLKGFGATFFSWTSHYSVVNFLILALIFGLNGSANHTLPSIVEHINIFARQLILWVMMMVFPTPGGTGLSEVIFLEYMKIFIPTGFVSIMTVIWRLICYYPYLFIGAVILPGWINRSFKHHRNEEIEVK